MIYKKIGDKIPSLSGLLLAGVVLCSGCPNKDKEQHNNEDPANSLNGSEGEGTSPGKDEGGKAGGQKLSSDLAEAIQKIKRVFIDCSGVSHLAGKAKPFVYNLDDLKNLDNTTLCEKAKGLLASFSDEKSGIAAAYSKDFRAFFERLEKDVLKTKVYSSYPYAFILALQNIAEAWKKLHTVYGTMVEKINSCMPQDSLKPLVDELDKFIEESDKIFDPTKGFLDNPTKSYAMLSGARLVRFLHGESRRGTKYPEVVALLDGVTVDYLWVNFKTDAEQSPGAKQENVLEGGIFKKKGGEILAAWKVDGDDTIRMPKVSAISNKNSVGASLTKKFKPVSGTVDDIQESGDALKIFETITKPDKSSQFNLKAAIKTQGITFKQLLFTLFSSSSNSGSSKTDFLKLEAGKSGNDTVKIIGIDKVYKDWVDACASEERFAHRLGAHIESSRFGLSNLFVIPNVDDLEKTLLSGISDAKPANSGIGAVAATEEQKNTDGETVAQAGSGSLGEDSQSVSLIKNIFRAFSANQVTSGTPAQLLTKIKKLGDLHGTDDVNGSDLTFEQRVCIRLAKTIGAASYLTSMKEGSARSLIHAVTSAIDMESNHAILVLKGGAYSPTEATRRILDAFKKFDDQLRRKYRTASLSYEQIEDQISSLDPNSNLKFEQVHQFYVDECNALRGVIAAEVEPIVKMPFDPKQKVNYGTHFSGVKGLTDPYYTSLDAIREEYHKKEIK
ncbi:hypothetical protein [Cardinium endosymbiont of Nabis limbatus]|uniref:hypothetical protein n=1 Tax=Cardinium endosymbiont of Nabis limbatus TaxID=3066217 RepID=UPI003AF3C179